MAVVVAVAYMHAGGQPVQHRLAVSTPLDALIPLVPATAWFYLPGYAALFVLAVLALERVRDFHAALLVVAGSTLVAVAAFVGLGVPVPHRPPVTDAGLSEAMVRWLYTVDPAANAFPSLHVTNSVICAGIVRRLWPRMGPLVLALAVGVTLSTLTLRQHWLADVVAGGMLGSLGLAAWERLRQHRPQPTAQAA